ncbi:MAG: protein translocase subunit SecF, partial [Gammaproteobacteria bacterium]
MQLVSRALNIDFMGPRRIAVAISIVAIVVSLASLVTRGLQLGLDFTGGAVIEVRYDQPADLENIRGMLQSAGFEGAIVQNFGAASEVLIRLPPASADNDGDNGGGDADVDGAALSATERAEATSNLADEVIALLQTDNPSVEQRRADYVGPQIGEELVEKGGQALLFVLVMVFLYIVIRFRWKFAAGAIAALVHDVIITFGFFSIAGLEFDQTVLAAVLAVIGYSLNDTIVVYDRIRENFRLMRRGTAQAIINTSINQTLSRTIITA